MKKRNASKKCYPLPADLPEGKSIGNVVWKYDPSPPWIKTLWIVLTVAGLVYMLFSSYIVMAVTGMDDSWDKNNGYDANKDWLLDLVAITLGLSVESVQTMCLISYGLYGLLIALDISLDPGDKTKITSIKTHPWPVSWKTDNTVCYHEMFSEPTRFGRILRRPCNTLSNVNYLLASMCVLASSLTSGKPSVFWMADVLFSIMLFFLAVFSNLWHASNAPWSQYPDIWAMDCCILYLVVRYCCLGGCKALILFGGMESSLAQQLAGASCLLVYATIIIGIGKLEWNFFQKGYMHGGCPFSGRARLLGKGDLWGQGQIDCHVSTVCAFAILPVVYTGIPTAIQVWLIDSVGSVAAANWVFRTLAIGWTYRLWDRWVLDGCLFMKLFSPTTGKPSWISTVGSALFSPTAVLHFFTGLTLLTGYMHCRSVEEFAR